MSKTNWFKRVRTAALLGVAWAVVWGPIAILIGMLIIDPDNSMDEMWLAIGAYPALLSAVVFSAMLGMPESLRKLADNSLGRTAALGASSGLIVGTLPFLVGTSTSELPLWQLALLVVGSIAALSALSAVGSALLARVVSNREVRAFS
jgi:hypothetical protein